MITYAYARVSARNQNLFRQLAAFAEYGIEKTHVYADKKSGKNFERKVYARLLKKLRRGDLLAIKYIDRLGRNYDQIISEWSKIVNTLGADILVLDTRAKANSLIGKFISDIVLQVLSFVAENERETTRQRQAEGIKAAKIRGVRFGRPKIVFSDIFLKVAAAYKNNDTSLSDGQRLNLSRAAQLVGIPPPISFTTTNGILRHSGIDAMFL